MARNKTVAIKHETYDLLVKLCAKNNRTIMGQIDWMVRNMDTAYRVISISDLPHPPDAEPIPLIKLAQLEA